VSEDGFGYTVTMVDGMSGPARAEVAALKLLQGALGEAEKAVREFSKKQGLGELHDEVKNLRATAGDGGGLPSWLKLAAVTYAAREAARAMAAIRGFVIDSAEFKENTTLAYAAVQGTAEEGEKTFALIDRMARHVHMPAREAHKIAQQLMLDGVEDTKLIAKAIGAESALIRTGQEQGAAKLRSIIERSEASGHFDVRGLAQGQGRALTGLGVHAPDLLASLAARTHQSIPQLQKALQDGKVAADVGIAALLDAVSGGPIGSAARAKFDWTDFVTDVTNAFQGLAQGVDLSRFNAALRDADEYIMQMASQGGPIADFFQSVVNGAATSIGYVQTLTAVVIDVAKSFRSAGDDGTSVFSRIIPGTIKVAEIAFVELAGFVDILRDGLKQIVGQFQFLGRVIADPMNVRKYWNEFIDGSRKASDAYAGGAERRQNLIDRIWSGQEGVVKREEAVGIAFKRSGDAHGHAISKIVNQHKHAHQALSDMSIEDLIFKTGAKGDFMGGLDLPMMLKAIHKSAGWEALDVSPATAAGSRQAVSSSSPASGPMTGGKSVSLHIDALYLGREHEDADRLRSDAEMALTDVLERFALELGS
jgi:hypothetical protein